MVDAVVCRGLDYFNLQNAVYMVAFFIKAGPGWAWEVPILGVGSGTSRSISCVSLQGLP